MNLFVFDQSPYTSESSRLAANGSVYIPTACTQQLRQDDGEAGCRLHVFLVGCDGPDFFLPLVEQDMAQYQQIAEANRMVLLFPKPLQNTSGAKRSEQAGCFDSWGDTGAGYATRQSGQMAAMRRMVHALSGR